MQGNYFLFPKHCLLTGSNTGSSGQGSNAVYRSLAQPLLYSEHSSGTFDPEDPFCMWGYRACESSLPASGSPTSHCTVVSDRDSALSPP